MLVHLNRLLIPNFGIEGAEIATLVGYACSLILMIIILIRMDLLVISKGFLLSCSIVSGYLYTWKMLYTDNFIEGWIVTLFGFIVMIVLYKK